MWRGLTVAATAAALFMWGVPAAGASTTWTLQSTPTPAHGVDGELFAVSCVAASDCIAVGQYTVPAGTVPLAEHWNGTRWSVQATPVPSGTSFAALNGVSCTSAKNCMAVGTYQTSPGAAALPLAEHWDGSAWAAQAMTVPSGGFLVNVNAVSCPSATNCTAVGEYEKDNSPALSLAESWNGSEWTVQPMPVISRSASQVLLKGVSCTAPGACTAVGWFVRGRNAFVTLAETSVNGTWRIRSVRGPSATLGQLLAVSCAAKNSCAAVGTTGSAPIAESWNGSTWALQPIASPTTGLLNGVWCVSAGTCTAVGASGQNAVTGNNPSAMAEGLSGGTWQSEATASPPTGQELAGVSCVSATVCTAVGYRPLTDSTASSPLAEQSS